MAVPAGAFFFDPLEIVLPSLPSSTPPCSHCPDILMILVESLRADVVPAGIMPGLREYADRGPCVESAYHYANAHATQFGLFALFYGMYPYHYEYAAQERLQPLSMEYLKRAGYRLTGRSCSGITGWNRAEFMLGQFDDMLIRLTQDKFPRKFGKMSIL